MSVIAGFSLAKWSAPMAPAEASTPHTRPPRASANNPPSQKAITISSNGHSRVTTRRGSGGRSSLGVWPGTGAGGPSVKIDTSISTAAAARPPTMAQKIPQPPPAACRPMKKAATIAATTIPALTPSACERRRPPVPASSHTGWLVNSSWNQLPRSA